MYKDERLSFVPVENYLKIKDIIDKSFCDQNGAFKTVFWSTDRLLEWVEENRSLYDDINRDYYDYEALSPFGALF